MSAPSDSQTAFTGCAIRRADAGDTKDRMAHLRRAGVLAVVLSACTSPPPAATAPPPAPVASASTAAPIVSAPKPPLVCLPATAAKGEVVHVEAKDGKLVACFLDEKTGEGNTYASPGQSHPCVLVDPDGGTLTSAPAYVVPSYAEPVAPALTITTTADSVKVCKSTQCKTVKVDVKPAKKVGKKAAKPTIKNKGKKPAPEPPLDVDAPPGLSAFVDDAMSKLFVFVPDQAKDGALLLRGDTFELATGKRTARVPLTGVLDGVFVDGTNTWSGTWIGNRVLLHDQVCCGPGAATVILDPIIGTMKFVHSYAGSFSQHMPTKGWYVTNEKAFSRADPEAMSITPIVTAPGEALDPEATSATWAPVGDRIAFVYANPPGFTLIDPATNKAGPLRSIGLCTP